MAFEIIRVKNLFEENDELIGQLYPMSIDGGEVKQYRLIGFDSPYALLGKFQEEEE